MSAVKATDEPKKGSKKGNPDPNRRSRSSGGSSSERRNKTPPAVKKPRSKDEHGRKDKGDDQHQDPEVYKVQDKIARDNQAGTSAT